MSEAKHTPGPWIVITFDSLADAKENGAFPWAHEWDEAKRGKPAEVWRGTEGGGHTGLPGSIEVGEHNARLIAAAPDLYAALLKAREFIVNGVEYGYIHLPDRGDSALDTLPLIESALAKVDG
jgi:hypothetical protein